MLALLEFLLLVVVPVWALTTLLTRWIESFRATGDAPTSMATLIEQSEDVSSRVDALERALGKRPEDVEVVRP